MIAGYTTSFFPAFTSSDMTRVLGLIRVDAKRALDRVKSGKPVRNKSRATPVAGRLELSPNNRVEYRCCCVIACHHCMTFKVCDVHAGVYIVIAHLQEQLSYEKLRKYAWRRATGWIDRGNSIGLCNSVVVNV